jgi:AcrR family transcriptional regulator
MSVPRTKDREERLADIASAAKEVFMSRGYQGATMQEIAEKAGIGKGTIYLYYKGKEDLYTGLMLPSLDYAREKFHSLLEATGSNIYRSGEDFLGALADLLVDLHDRDPEMGMVYQAFQIGSLFTGLSKEAFSQLSRAGKENFQLLRRIFASAIERGLIQEVDVVKTVDALWGVYVGITQVEWHKLRWTRKDHLRETLHYAFSLVCTGLCQRERANPTAPGYGDKAAAG